MTFQNLPRLEASGAKEISSMLNTLSVGNVLDVCTGEGEFISTLMETIGGYERFVGVDFSLNGLEKAHEDFAVQPVQLLAMDAEYIGFADNTFDTVCLTNSLHHLRHQELVLAEIKRVLKPGGFFILQEMYHDGNQSEAQITGILEHHFGAKIDRLLDEPHYETLTQKEIRKRFQALELEEVVTLEASRYVNCLTCPQRFECENPLNEKLIDDFIQGINHQLERLGSHEKLDELRIEGEKLKERVKATGVSDASFLFIIGKKDI
jgi:ubiquinone/menaquinone biosynthesis C-methylase UbiE